MPTHTPEIISETTYQEIATSGKLGPTKHGYPAVIFHANDTVTKLWAKKTGWLSSSRWRPYSTRFIKNAELLKQEGIHTPEIISHMRIARNHVHLVQYHSLPGKSIRELLVHHPEQVDIPSLAQYFYDLHEKGIIFRAIHFGNVIQISTGKYGLIDFTDVSFLKYPVPLTRRAANIATPLRYREDVKCLKESNLPDFLEAYLEILRKNIGDFDENAFTRTIKERIKKRS